jgi:hypothetical protein
MSHRTPIGALGAMEMEMSQPNFAVVITVECDPSLPGSLYAYEHKVVATAYTLAYAKALLGKQASWEMEIGGYIKPLTTRGHLEHLAAQQVAQQALNAELPF